MWAWLTPDSIDASTRRAVIDLPQGEYFLEYLAGAILELCETHNWEAHGAATIDEVIEAWERAFDTLRWEDGMIGDIKQSVSGAETDEWIIADGRALQEADYPEMAAICGVRYGVGLPGEFVIPDLRGRMLLGASGTHPVDQRGGAERVAINVGEMAPHSHLYDRGVIALATLGVGSPILNIASNLTLSTQSTGSGSSHENMPPFQVVYTMIKVK